MNESLFFLSKKKNANSIMIIIIIWNKIKLYKIQIEVELFGRSGWVFVFVLWTVFWSAYQIGLSFIYVTYLFSNRLFSSSLLSTRKQLKFACRRERDELEIKWLKCLWKSQSLLSVSLYHYSYSDFVCHCSSRVYKITL